MVRGTAFLLSHMFLHEHYPVWEQWREFSCFPPVLEGPSSNQSFPFTLTLYIAEGGEQEMCTSKFHLL